MLLLPDTAVSSRRHELDALRVLGDMTALPLKSMRNAVEMAHKALTTPHKWSKCPTRPNCLSLLLVSDQSLVYTNSKMKSFFAQLLALAAARVSVAQDADFPGIRTLHSARCRPFTNIEHSWRTDCCRNELHHTYQSHHAARRSNRVWFRSRVPYGTHHRVH